MLRVCVGLIKPSQMDRLLPTSAEHPHEVHGALCLAEMQIVRFALAYAMLSADASKGSPPGGRVVCDAFWRPWLSE